MLATPRSVAASVGDKRARLLPRRRPGAARPREGARPRPCSRRRLRVAPEELMLAMETGRGPGAARGRGLRAAGAWPPPRWTAGSLEAGALRG